MIIPKAARIEGKSASSTRELEEYVFVQEYVDVQGDAKLEDLFCGGGDEEWVGGYEICKGWRSGLDPSCERVEVLGVKRVVGI